MSLTKLYNSIGLTYIKSQKDLENWNGTSDIIVMSDFTISGSFNKPNLYKNINIEGNNFTITVDASTIDQWNGFFILNSNCIVKINVSNLNINFSSFLTLNGLIFLNNQPPDTYVILFSKCTNVMQGYFESYFLT